ncbi:MAG: hypothetical protein F6K55_40780 [Moorea sp. SIO4A3]|nr:hypothetical protein [Moorena sp. SIO4A3]
MMSFEWDDQVIMEYCRDGSASEKCGNGKMAEVNKKLQCYGMSSVWSSQDS